MGELARRWFPKEHARGPRKKNTHTAMSGGATSRLLAHTQNACSLGAPLPEPAASMSLQLTEPACKAHFTHTLLDLLQTSERALSSSFTSGAPSSSDGRAQTCREEAVLGAGMHDLLS